MQLLLGLIARVGERQTKALNYWWATQVEPHAIEVGGLVHVELAWQRLSPGFEVAGSRTDLNLGVSELDADGQCL